MIYTPERVDLDERTWGCRLKHCLSLAECLFDGTPYCLDCADLVLERLLAVQIAPILRQSLPDLEAPR